MKTEDFSHDECFPFILEDEGSGSCGSPSFTRTSLVESSKGFKHEKDVDRQETAANTYNKMDRCSIFRYSSSASVNKAMSMLGIHRPVANQDDPLSSVYQPPMGSHLRGIKNIQYISSYLYLICNILASSLRTNQSILKFILICSGRLIRFNSGLCYRVWTSYGCLISFGECLQTKPRQTSKCTEDISKYYAPIECFRWCH